MNDKSCTRCHWLRKYTAKNGSWMNVCESMEPDDQEEGLCLVTVIDTKIFDASYCLNFSKVDFMGIFGCSSKPSNETFFCEVCGQDDDHCICQECPNCGEIGTPACYQKHGLVFSRRQRISLKYMTLKELESQEWQKIENRMELEENEREKERRRFEEDAAPYGFDLTRTGDKSSVEPWAEYQDDATGHRWAGWLACNGLA